PRSFIPKATPPRRVTRRKQSSLSRRPRRTRRGSFGEGRRPPPRPRRSPPPRAATSRCYRRRAMRRCRRRSGHCRTLPRNRRRDGARNAASHAQGLARREPAGNRRAARARRDPTGRARDPLERTIRLPFPLTCAAAVGFNPSRPLAVSLSPLRPPRAERNHSVFSCPDDAEAWTSMMDKSFDAAAVEARVSALWEETGAFRAGRPERKDAKPFCVVIPPPNVTGNLHMGHALNNTLQDILCRYHRMNGKDVLWQPGTDHAGIATQIVVERQLAERQEADRRTLGRDAFLARVWEWKTESGGAIVDQLKRLGASCDWSRERFTLDEGLSKAVARVFVQLHHDGLIYKAKRLVNWDPKFQTAISDLEVVQVDCKGSFKWSR